MDNDRNGDVRTGENLGASVKPSFKKPAFKRRSAASGASSKGKGKQQDISRESSNIDNRPNDSRVLLNRPGKNREN